MLQDVNRMYIFLKKFILQNDLKMYILFISDVS